MSEADGRETQEPDAAHTGRNVVDFESPGVLPAVRKAVDLLPPANWQGGDLAGLMATLKEGYFDSLGAFLEGR